MWTITDEAESSPAERNRPGSPRPGVSVVIATCANARALERAITSVLHTGYEPLEIIVVENRPPASNTRRVVEEFSANGPVRYVEEPRRGASWARNAGLSYAEGELVAFIDDDVVVDQSWVKSAIAAFELPEQASCVTGRIMPLALKTSCQALFDQFAAFDKGSERRIFRSQEGRGGDPLFPYAAGHVGSGANVFIRRDVVVAMGGFDPVLGPGTLTVGGEDLDLFIRLAHAGRTIVYDPAVVLKHDHPDSAGALRRHAFYYGIGLTAVLSKQLLQGPARAKLLRMIPAGVSYALDPESRKNAMKSKDYPKILDVLERIGMMLGPVAYLLSLAEPGARKLWSGTGRAGRAGRVDKRLARVTDGTGLPTEDGPRTRPAPRQTVPRIFSLIRRARHGPMTVPVLLYHAIDELPQKGKERWTVSPREFSQHVEVIAASGRVPLTISELAECLRGERRLDSDAVAVTFDDGYASTHDAVLELLRRDISSTVYITTDKVDAPGMLSVAQLEDLAGLSGVELGAHSVTHPKLDEISGARLDEEVAGSRRALETLLGISVASFAYPDGSHDARTRAAAVRAGYRSAAAVKDAISHLEDDPFAIARWTVTARTSPERLAGVLRGEGVPLAWNRERMRTTAYRSARRARRWLGERIRFAGPR